MARQQVRAAVMTEDATTTIHPPISGATASTGGYPVFVHTLARRFVSRSRLVSGEASFLREAVVRIPPALLSGLLAAVLGGLLLPGNNAVTAVALSLGVVSAVWILSLLYSLNRVWTALLWVSGPLFSYLFTEILIGNIRFNPFLLYLSDIQSFLNLSWYYLAAALLYAATGAVRISAGCMTVLGWVWGNLNAYVFQFRGRILFPADIHAFRTAVMLTSDYDWSPSALQLISCGWLILFLVALKLVVPASVGQDGQPFVVRKPKGRLPIRASIAAISLLGMYLFFATPLVGKLGVVPSQWFTQQNGVLLNFMINLKNSQVTKPSAYAAILSSMNQIPHSLDSAIPPSPDSMSLPSPHSAIAPSLPSEPGIRPNIIVVMNEAFSDLRVLGNIKTNEDPLPFFHSLTKNTIRGKAYSSVIGGNTANSEYEFLTGNTMAFLPAGMVSYQIYTSPGDYSLTGQLNQFGYKTIAMHPYESAGWNRVQVYQNYGFSEVHFMDAYQNKQYVRNYISDRSNYRELIRRFDAFQAQDKDTPLFMMNVTMQNHGGYHQTWDRLAHRIHVAEEGYTPAHDVDGKYADVNQYLSLIRESDDAYKMLIEHFEKEEEPTLILFFGDHQPKLSDNFYKNVFGKAPEAFTPEETQRMYTVPFSLWANFDIPEARNERISLNYLSSLLLEQANLPLTPYQAFLSDMRQAVPVINSMGMSGADGAFVTREHDLSPTERDYVAQYRAYQYNGIFDKNNRVESFFKIPQNPSQPKAP